MDSPQQNQKLLFGSEDDSKNSSIGKSQILAPDTFEDPPEIISEPPVPDKSLPDKTVPDKSKSDESQKEISNAEKYLASTALKISSNSKVAKTASPPKIAENHKSPQQSPKSAETEHSNLNKTAQRVLKDIKQLQVKLPRIEHKQKSKIPQNSDLAFVKETKIQMKTAPSANEVDSFEFEENCQKSANVSISSNEGDAEPRRGRRRTRYENI